VFGDSIKTAQFLGDVPHVSEEVFHSMESVLGK